MSKNSKDVDWERLRRERDAISTWEDWARFERESLGIPDWPLRSLDDMDRNLERPDRVRNGRRWYACSSSYDVSPDIEHFLETARAEVFNRLEPVAAEENRNHPHRIARRCVYCRVYTLERCDTCDFCGHEVVEMHLGDDGEDDD